MTNYPLLIPAVLTVCACMSMTATRAWRQLPRPVKVDLSLGMLAVCVSTTSFLYLLSFVIPGVQPDVPTLGELAIAVAALAVSVVYIERPRCRRAS